jgi:hypothetical protein
MDRQILEPHVNPHAEEQSENAKCNSDQQKVVAIHAKEVHGRKVGNFKRSFAAGLGRLGQGCGCGQKQQNCEAR